MNVVSFDLWLAGDVPARAEPLIDRKRARHYPNPVTVDGMARWRKVWLAHRLRPYVAGPVSMTLAVTRKRPPSHLLRDGTLSAAGRRFPLCSSKPDLDNCLKLVADALKGLALDDDAVIVTVTATKGWSDVAGGLLIVRSVSAVVT